MVCVHLCVQIGCVIHVCVCMCVYMCMGRGEWLQKLQPFESLMQKEEKRRRKMNQILTSITKQNHQGHCRKEKRFGCLKLQQVYCSSLSGSAVLSCTY